MTPEEAERVSIADQHWAEMRNFIPSLYSILAKLRLSKKLTKKETTLVAKCVAMVMLRVDDSLKEIYLGEDDERSS